MTHDCTSADKRTGRSGLMRVRLLRQSCLLPPAYGTEGSLNFYPCTADLVMTVLQELHQRWQNSLLWDV